MSNERDTQAGGNPVEQAEATPTQVQAAVHRAVAPVKPVMVQPPVSAHEGPQQHATPAPSEQPEALPEVLAEAIEINEASSAHSAVGESARIAPIAQIPSAGENQTPEQIFAAAAASSGAARATQQVASSPAADQNKVDQSLPVENAVTEQPADQQTVAFADQPVRDGEIRISADHPMATLYMQSPMPPDLRGNRVAGFWISVLSTVAFALVFAGAIALILSPAYPPSTYVSAGLMPALLSATFFVPVIAFLLVSIVVILIVGRAGWWAHIIGSLFVALVTGAAALAAMLVDNAGGVNSLLNSFSSSDLTPGVLVSTFGIIVLAREISMWFGAWIGARGRKMARLNNEALDEYEIALAEVKSPQGVAAPLS